MESKSSRGYKKKPNGWMRIQLDVTLELMVNYEAERVILSNADSVKMNFPKSLVRRIKKKLEKAM